MRHEITGLNEVRANLRKMQERAKQLAGPHELTFNEMFSPDFMRARTQFGSIQELFDASGFQFETQEDYTRITQSEEWKAFIARTTKFASWDEMRATAAREHVARKLGFK